MWYLENIQLREMVSGFRMRLVIYFGGIDVLLFIIKMKLISDNGDFCKFWEVKCFNFKVGLIVQCMFDK